MRARREARSPRCCRWRPSAAWAARSRFHVAVAARPCQPLSRFRTRASRRADRSSASNGQSGAFSFRYAFTGKPPHLGPRRLTWLSGGLRRLDSARPRPQGAPRARPVRPRRSRLGVARDGDRRQVHRARWAGWLAGIAGGSESTPGRSRSLSPLRQRLHLLVAGHGAHEVHGAIRGSGPSSAGNAASSATRPRTNTPDGVGRFNHFQGGSIFLTPTTGHARCTARSADSGPSSAGNAASSATRSPTRRLPPTARSLSNHFQGGSIYWTAGTGAHEARRDPPAVVPARLGTQLPRLPDHGRVQDPRWSRPPNHFQGGSIYWTPPDRRTRCRRDPRPLVPARLGTQLPRLPAYERIQDPGRHRPLQPLPGRLDLLDPHHRGARGGARRDPRTLVPARLERSFLGYPISNEMAWPTAPRASLFQHGAIVWSAAGGAVAVRELIRLHVKVLTTPTVPITTSLAEMQTVYAAAEIVICASIETLNLPVLNDATSANARADDSGAESALRQPQQRRRATWSAYSTNPPLNGCAAPQQQAGSDRRAGRDALDAGPRGGPRARPQPRQRQQPADDRNGTANITNPPPDLIARRSPPCASSNLTV